jgi:hypothetical protein
MRAKLFFKFNSIIYERPLIAGPAIMEVNVLSDYYYGAVGSQNMGYEEDAELQYRKACELHSWLEDITVANKDADEYSIEEIAAVGKERNDHIYSKLSEQFKAGGLNVSLDEVDEFLTHKIFSK